MTPHCFIPIVAILAQTPPRTQPVPPDTLAIEHVTVLPMDRDTALPDHTVLVWQDRIVWLGPSRNARVPRRAQRVDGRNRFLMPGLVDMHVHINEVRDLARYLAAGVTTVRIMHGGPQQLSWRGMVASGTLSGPTIFTSGPPIGEGDPRFVPLRTTADAERVAREQAEAGYDMIKVITRISLPAYQRLLETASALHIPVVGHVIAEVGLDRSLQAGQVSLEHAYTLRQRSRFASLLGNDQAGLDEDARAIARSGAWVGTIASSRNGRCDQRTPQMLRHIAALHRAKVRLLAGTDAGIGPVPAGAALHCELATLVAAGLTPYEALATATANAGAFATVHLKRQRAPFGTVTVGAVADLVLLSADPRAHIEAVASPIGIVLRGAWLPH